MSTISLTNLGVAPCRHGVMVWPRSDATIGRSLERYGEFAEGENERMATYLRPGDVAVDVGANLGTTVLPMARRVGPTGMVVAFEPQPLMAQCLQTTLTLNELFHVRVMTCAVGDQTTWAAIPHLGVGHGGNYGSIGLGKEGLPTPVMRLDDYPFARCDLIKVDVEGYEWPVVQGAEQTLRKHGPVLYLEAKRTLPQTRLWLERLLTLGYRCYWHFAFFYRANNFRRQAENLFGGTGDMNVLAVPPNRPQPDDLPRIAVPDEDWQAVYEPFFRSRNRSAE